MDDNGITLVLIPVQLYAWLNGKSISQSELASNTWHEMPWPDRSSISRYLQPMDMGRPPAAGFRDPMTHYTRLAMPLTRADGRLRRFA